MRDLVYGDVVAITHEHYLGRVAMVVGTGAHGVQVLLESGYTPWLDRSAVMPVVVAQD